VANIDNYEVFITPFDGRADQQPRKYSTQASKTDYHFKGLQPLSNYNVSVQGLAQDKKLWFISGNFATTDKVEAGPIYLNWLTAPIDLRLIDKSGTMLHVEVLFFDLGL